MKRLAQFPQQSMSDKWQLLLLENMNGNDSLKEERTYLEGWPSSLQGSQRICPAIRPGKGQLCPETGPLTEVLHFPPLTALPVLLRPQCLQPPRSKATSDFLVFQFQSPLQKPHQDKTWSGGIDVMSSSSVLKFQDSGSPESINQYQEARGGS